MLSLEGNTAPYHLYTHARIKSVLRKYETEVGPLPVEPELLVRDANERNLVMLLDGLSQQVESAATDLKPNYLTEYLFKLSGEFNSYYNRKDAPVLKEPDARVRESRVALYALVGRTLKCCLDILGIRALERM
jgi:arginyl-tRNA synthetase